MSFFARGSSTAPLAGKLKEPDAIEQRAFDRWSVRTPVRLTTGSVETLATRDLSKGGCCLETSSPLVPGQTVQLAFGFGAEGFFEPCINPLW